MTKLDPLTAYPAGSFKGLCRITLPLMLSALSANLMLFIDRLILANYSTTAMNASASAGIVAYIFIFALMCITGIAEVFVGQHNGAKNYKKVGQPVWQMIWFSLMSLFIFAPIAFWGAHFLIPEILHEDGIPYFHWLMYFGPIFGINVAFSAFFAGRGQTTIITYAVIIGALLNLALDLILVFGFQTCIPAMGTTGAAIATVVSEIVQTFILAAIFLKKSHREKYKTHEIKFLPKIFKDCLKIGYPSAVGHMIEMSAWSFLFHMTANISVLHVTILTMGQNMLILFAFFAEGLQKGVIAVASNLIGAKKWPAMKRLMISACKLHFLIIAIIGIPLLLYPEGVMDVFEIDKAIQFIDPIVLEQTLYTLRYVWIYLFFDGLVWAIAGVLTAGGDTRFIMVVNAASSWIAGVLPIYLFVHLFPKQPSLIWGMTAFYGIVNLTFFFLRYRSNKWRKLQLY